MILGWPCPSLAAKAATVAYGRGDGGLVYMYVHALVWQGGNVVSWVAGGHSYTSTKGSTCAQ